MRESTSRKFSFECTSLKLVHDPAPLARNTPDVTDPSLLTPEMNLAPPVARTVHELLLMEEIVFVFESAQTKEPWLVACARLPAANVDAPCATFCNPPAIKALEELFPMLFRKPPAMEELSALLGQMGQGRLRCLE